MIELRVSREALLCSETNRVFRVLPRRKNDRKLPPDDRIGALVSDDLNDRLPACQNLPFLPRTAAQVARSRRKRDTEDDENNSQCPDLPALS